MRTSLAIVSLLSALAFSPTAAWANNNNKTTVPTSSANSLKTLRGHLAWRTKGVFKSSVKAAGASVNALIDTDDVALHSSNGASMADRQRARDDAKESHIAAHDAYQTLHIMIGNLIPSLENGADKHDEIAAEEKDDTEKNRLKGTAKSLRDVVTLMKLAHAGTDIIQLAHSNPAVHVSEPWARATQQVSHDTHLILNKAHNIMSGVVKHTLRNGEPESVDHSH